ncbi:MAG: Fur family transcriptional regulator [Nitrospiria bacterium]
MGKKEEALLEEHISRNHLKITKERKAVLKAFLEAERHITVEKLYRNMKDQGSSIGLATVYRSLNIFCESGLAERHQFGEKQTLYELTCNVRHHDHLICQQCSRILEFENKEIEKLQEKVAKQHKFSIFNHKLELYGICADCAKENQQTPNKRF